jgi:hypothetical protein
VEVPCGTRLGDTATSIAHSCEVSPGGVTVLSKEPRPDAAGIMDWHRQLGISGGASRPEQPVWHGRERLPAHHPAQ